MFYLKLNYSLIWLQIWNAIWTPVKSTSGLRFCAISIHFSIYRKVVYSCYSVTFGFIVSLLSHPQIPPFSFLPSHILSFLSLKFRYIFSAPTINTGPLAQKIMTFFSRVISNLLFTNHHTIWPCEFRANESVVNKQRGQQSNCAYVDFTRQL
jgi:hypothetical protein